jgi:serine/threonine protein kinase
MSRVRNRAGRTGGNPDFDPQQPPAIPGLANLIAIGSGASATVYRADEPAMKRKVAIKVLHALVRDARGRQAFERECQLAGHVGEHVFAADIFRSDFVGDRPYVVMRYYARGNLASRLAPGNRLTTGEAIKYCAQVATALQYAHDRGILHRDIKPENILCDAFGSPVLADFGVATDRDSATMALHHAMTAAYAAPEVLQHGGGWTYSDVWSLAATLYALLAGHPPWYDPHQPDPRANLAALVGPLPPTGNPDVPQPVEETLARALIGPYDTRIGSARLLATELNASLRLLGEEPVPLRTDVPHPAAEPVSQTAATNGTGPQIDTTSRSGRPAGSPAADPGSLRAPSGGNAGGAGDNRSPVPSSQPTGYLPTDLAHRPPESPPQSDSRQRRLPRIVATAIGAVVLVGLAVTYIAGGHHPGRPRPSASASPTDGVKASGVRSPGGSALLPPTGVSAASLTGSSVRISWTNPARESAYKQVVISGGAGFPPQAVANDSPQIISGLNPGQGYCFSVGYVYDLQGKVSYSSPPACIRGGVAPSG